MSGEAPGTYVMINGQLVPEATLMGQKGSTGTTGDKGSVGAVGAAATGVIVSDTAPANPVKGTLWLGPGN